MLTPAMLCVLISSVKDASFFLYSSSKAVLVLIKPLRTTSLSSTSKSGSSILANFIRRSTSSSASATLSWASRNWSIRFLTRTWNFCIIPSTTSLESALTLTTAASTALLNLIVFRASSIFWRMEAIWATIRSLSFWFAASSRLVASKKPTSSILCINVSTIFFIFAVFAYFWTYWRIAPSIDTTPVCINASLGFSLSLPFHSFLSASSRPLISPRTLGGSDA